MTDFEKNHDKRKIKMLNGLESNESIYIGVGTNLGDRLENIKLAIQLLDNEGVKVLRTASIYETKAVGFESEDDFYNTVFEIQTSFSALDLLKITQEVERKIGRKPKVSTNYESRIIDLDILFYKNEVFNTFELTIPHPRIKQRKFVLHPLKELIINSLNKSLNPVFRKLKNTSIDEMEPIIVHKPLLVS
ncbi:MAG: 2-amino-4-hydroxy-6-hydroxymethyldihydropteridine diphosphokinase [Fluviicola sp.]|jgi:2-amino-4-hydroxy-6-hydroxymethyldihydropteridine diphosphokinase